MSCCTEQQHEENMDAIDELIDFGLNTAYDDLPAEVVERTRMAILDTLGAMLAGTRGEGVDMLSDLVHEWGGSGQATLVTTGQRMPMHNAALLNATAARAWDLDDVHEQNTCHVFASIVPALLAVAEARGPVSGKDALASAAIAAETVCRLSSAPRASFSETGSSLTYQCAQYAVALMAACLLKLTRTETRHALGIAHAKLSGNQQGFLAGAMTVRLMQGVSAESGIVSALMAEKGLTGSTEILEGKFGYFHVHHHGRYERADIVDSLGTRWELLQTSIKPASPCCKYTHAPIAAAIEARQTVGDTDSVEKLCIRVTNREVHDLVCLPRERKWNPDTLTAAQFSLPFTVAHAFIYGRVDLASFQSEGRTDPAVKAFMRRIEIDTDFQQQGDSRGTFPMPGHVTVHLKGGGEKTAEVTYVKGHPKNPMAMEEVAEKFHACTEFAGLARDRSEQIAQKIMEMHTLPDVGQLMVLCSGMTTAEHPQ